jgi:surface polysaccharide O-acyltransferase-like enzyme
LEWLRAGTTIGVVAFHAAIPYTRIPMPGLNWLVHEPVGSPMVDVICWALNGLIMPLFFLLAGFCSARIFARQGASNFVKQRTRRLMPPLVIGGLLILPVIGHLWFLSWAAQGFMPLDRVWRWGVPDELERDLYGLGHLWFVQTLWVFCVIVWMTSRLTERLSPRHIVRLRRVQMSLMNSFWMPVVFAIPATLALAADPRIVIGFRQSFLPQWANLAYYLPCFAAGFWLRRSERRGDVLARWCELRGILAVAVFVILWPFLQTHLRQESTGLNRWITAGLFSLYAWLSATSLFGLSVKFLRREAPAGVKYLSEGSLWVYLIHIPLVGLIQLNLLFVTLPAVLKFGLTLLGGLALSLATYHTLARRSRIGQFLSPVATSRAAIKGEESAIEYLPLSKPSPVLSPSIPTRSNSPSAAS